jgi:hypothetical protein
LGSWLRVMARGEGLTYTIPTLGQNLHKGKDQAT